MSGGSLIRLELRRLEEWRKYFEDPLKYVRVIKEVVRDLDRRARVLVFGSFVRGGLRPDSDIDVLIITDLASSLEGRLRVRLLVARALGDCTPFEIHVVTHEEFEGWYSRFIKDYVEV